MKIEIINILLLASNVITIQFKCTYPDTSFLSGYLTTIVKGKISKKTAKGIVLSKLNMNA